VNGDIQETLRKVRLGDQRVQRFAGHPTDKLGRILCASESSTVHSA